MKIFWQGGVGNQVLIVLLFLRYCSSNPSILHGYKSSVQHPARSSGTALSGPTARLPARAFSGIGGFLILFFIPLPIHIAFKVLLMIWWGQGTVLVHAGSVWLFAMKVERISYLWQIWERSYSWEVFLWPCECKLTQFLSYKMIAISDSCFMCRSEYFTPFLLVGCEETYKIKLESDFHESRNTSSACSLGIWHLYFTFHHATQILTHVQL